MGEISLLLGLWLMHFDVVGYAVGWTEDAIVGCGISISLEMGQMSVVISVMAVICSSLCFCIVVALNCLSEVYM